MYALEWNEKLRLCAQERDRIKSYLVIKTSMPHEKYNNGVEILFHSHTCIYSDQLTLSPPLSPSFIYFILFFSSLVRTKKKMKMYFSVSEIMCSCEYILQAVEWEERTRQKARWNQHFSVVSGFLCWIDAKKRIRQLSRSYWYEHLKRTQIKQIIESSNRESEK